MERNLRFYKVFSLIMAIVVASLLCAMGMIALHRSMTLKLGFNAEPSIYCYIEYKAPNEADSQYKPLFSNVTNTGAGLTPSVTANASLSGNTLTLTTEFEQLGASFDFRIYNYNNFGLKATCAGLSKSTSANTSAVNVATNASPIVFTEITTGGEKIVFRFEEYNAYTITFNANGGSGEMQAMEVEVGQPVILVTNTFTNSGYSFNGWNTKPDGTGTSYANLANFTPNSNITLYAMWKVAEFTITYENIVCVDATADNSENPTTYKDTTPTFTLEEPTKTGCEFLGWTWDGQTEPQKSVTITQGTTGNKTYKANWGATLISGAEYSTGDFWHKLVAQFTPVTASANNSKHEQIPTLFSAGLNKGIMIYVPTPSIEHHDSTMTSITFGYWEDYKSKFSSYPSGIAFDANSIGSIRFFKEGTTGAYLLSPNKIFAPINSANLCAQHTDDAFGGGCTCSQIITSLIFENFDTSRTTNMFQMFNYVQATILDLSSFDTSKVTDMTWMFRGCTNLEKIYVSDKWATRSDVTDSYSGMFDSCTSLVGGNGTAYSSSNITHTYARIDTASTPGYFTYKAAN